MMKHFLIVANWKENKTLTETVVWAQTVIPNFTQLPNLTVVICPPFVLIPELKNLLVSTTFEVGAQSISEFERGTYTGEVSGEALRGLVKYVIVGHSERRKFFGERNGNVAAKVQQALKYGIQPIVCVSDKVTFEGAVLPADSPFDENNFLNQIESVFNVLTPTEKQQVIFCYEPPGAISKPIGPIGVGQAAGMTEVETMIGKIKQTAADNLILYGGSVKSDNVIDFYTSELIDGVLLGSAGLNAEEFVKLVSNVAGVQA